MDLFWWAQLLAIGIGLPCYILKEQSHAVLGHQMINKFVILVVYFKCILDNYNPNNI